MFKRFKRSQYDMFFRPVQTNWADR